MSKKEKGMSLSSEKEIQSPKRKYTRKKTEIAVVSEETSAIKDKLQKIEKSENKVKSYAGSVGGLDLDSEGEKTRKVVNADLLRRFYQDTEPLRKAVDTTSRAVTIGRYHFEPWMSVKRDERHILILNRFFEDPNEEDEFVDLIRDISQDMLTFGDAYLEIVIDRLKWSRFIAQLNDKRVDPYNIEFPFSLFRLNPQTVKIETNAKGRVVGYTQKVGGDTIDFSASEVIHFKQSSPLDDNYGLAQSATLQNIIAAYIYATVYNAKFFENNATPRLHIDLGPNATDKDVTSFINKAEKELKGNPHKNLVTGGGVVVTPISLKNDEEFQVYQHNIRNEILTQYNVMPFVAGIVNDVGSTAPYQITIFKTLAVKPIQQIIESRVNKKIIKKLFPSVKLSFRFNPVDDMDASIVSELDTNDLKNQVRTINEVRQTRGLAPVEWGDTPVIPFSNAALAKLPTGKAKPEDENSNGKGKKKKDLNGEQDEIS